jgi:antitoxin VapB
MAESRQICLHFCITCSSESGNSQAVRLPSKLAYPAKTALTVTRIGDKIIIEPVKSETLDDFVNFFCSVGERHNGQRVELDIPERSLTVGNYSCISKRLAT